MTTARTALVRAAILGFVLIAYYVLVGITCDTGGTRNERDVKIRRFGNETVERSVGVSPTGTNALTLSPRRSGWSSASWDISSYEVSHLLNHALSCRVEIYIADSDISSASTRGSAEVTFDGDLVRRIGFSDSRRGLFPMAPGRYVPSDIVPSLIDIVPLDRRYGFVVPLSSSACSKQKFIVGVRARDVTWSVSAIGLALQYTPERKPLFGSLGLTVLAGALIATILGAALFSLLYGFSAIGLVPVMVATAVLAVAPLTYDQWDFPLWIRFSEMASFGGANPAHLWDASPFWAFVPPIFSTLTLTSYLVTGDGSRALTEIILKIAMALAYCYSAFAIARVAPRPLRPFLAACALLVPLGLYEIAGGYREPFATALGLAAFALTRRRAFAFGTIVFCAAASISETLLPIVLFPAAVALTGTGPMRARALRSGLLAALGIGLFVAEWAYLLPRDAAEHALTYRFGQAPLGSASWAAALAALGFLPTWLPVRSVSFGAMVFIVAAALPAIRLAATLRTPDPDESRRYVDVLAAFICFDAAFFVAFRGVDPNMWYTLFAVMFYYFASTDATNPFPLLFGSISGLVFYGILGLRDFVNHALFWPVDRGLLGVLGISPSIFAVMQTALVLCLIVALSIKDSKVLISTQSLWFFVLFAAAVATTAIRFYTLDFLLILAVCVVLASTFLQIIDARRRTLIHAPARLVQLAAAVAIGVFGALCSTRSAASGVAALGALLTSFAGFGLIDFVLALGSIALLAEQQGSGWTSIVGWTLLSTAVLYAALRGIRQRRTTTWKGPYSKQRRKAR